ncbi:unnamed protein product [Dracunculus medinensis]|uniref:Uncharacterized protein n=1 Tax=Dracunculus medinensis TaxID=318479 RepID=A0A3P7S9Y0_DRAME|nr:unnamed protein product [Dracunculus medinensis]
MLSVARKCELLKERSLAISHSLKFTDLEANKPRKIVFSDCDDGGVSIVNRHIGKRGAKLTEMEMKFGNDRRFKLDDRFFENFDDEAIDNNETENERIKELTILSKVLGTNVFDFGLNKAVKIRSKEIVPFSRFDPDDAQHSSWIHSRMGKVPNEEVIF